MVNNVDSKSYIDKTILWKTVTSSKMWKALSDIIPKVVSAICLLTKLTQCGKLFLENFHNVESMPTKLPQCGMCNNKTSAMWNVC